MNAAEKEAQKMAEMKALMEKKKKEQAASANENKKPASSMDKSP